MENHSVTKENLNAKIMEVTLTIEEHYPELSKYLEEMPETIPTEENPEISLNHLRSYYESLILMLNKYKLNHMR
jgi:hypothetical protein